jgi:teichuronic acid biosynthesis glycosyltransferase TuaC
MLPLAGMPSGPIPVLVVSSWYPSALDPVAGRFVADQVGSLAARGNVSPAVVSFDPADLIGSGAVRARIAGAVAAHVGAAVRTNAAVFLETAAVGPSVPLARLAVPSGRYREAGATHALAARVPALEALGERWTSGRETAVPVPAVIHAHTVYPDGAAAARLAGLLGCPLILTEHSSAVARIVAVPEVRAAYVAAVAAAERLIVVSRSLADELIRDLPEIASRVVVIPNGVAMDEFHPAPIEDRRPGELLFVGYRKATKGIETLLRAVALVRATHPDVSLRLIGGSPTEVLEAGWRRRAEELGIAEIAAFEGPADRAAIASAMARASLFVHPSPRETFGVVAVEALAAGTPVIATDSGGVTEILGPRPDELGAVVAPERPELLSAAIAAALDRRATFDPAALRASVESRFAASFVAERLEALYAEATAGRDHPPRRATVPTATAGSVARRVVVALDPARAAEVERLARLLADPNLTLVTSAEADVSEGAFNATARTRPGVRISGLADAAVLRSGSAGFGRWLQLIRHPVALARRRGWLGGLEDAAATAGDAAIRAAIIRAGTDNGDGLPEIVCADGIDHLAASAAIAEGLARPVPGGLRWLGDALAAGARRSSDPT